VEARPACNLPCLRCLLGPLGPCSRCCAPAHGVPAEAYAPALVRSRRRVRGVLLLRRQRAERLCRPREPEQRERPAGAGSQPARAKVGEAPARGGRAAQRAQRAAAEEGQAGRHERRRAAAAGQMRVRAGVRVRSCAALALRQQRCVGDSQRSNRPRCSAAAPLPSSAPTVR